MADREKMEERLIEYMEADIRDIIVFDSGTFLMWVEHEEGWFLMETGTDHSNRKWSYFTPSDAGDYICMINDSDLISWYNDNNYDDEDN